MELLLSIDRDGRRSLRDQLYDELRGAILDGRAPVGSRLPATRVLAAELGVSRLTVEDAFGRLIAEGYIEGRQGSGTYVLAAVSAVQPRPSGPPLDTTAASIRQPTPRRWSAWGTRAAATAAPISTVGPVRFDFRQGMPALDAFPLASWSAIRAREARALDPDHYHYGASAGDEHLRSALAAYLARSRGLRCTPEQIVVTSGAQQGLDILARLLVEPGDHVAVEDPGYPAARRVFDAIGATLIPIPVDRDGLRVDALPVAGSVLPRLVYVTPSHQYPTGGVMSLGRRVALLTWARERGAVVVEDDYDAEFRYGIRPVESLTGLDSAMAAPHARCAIYVGTLSKVLYPALRIGYLVVPRDMVDVVVAARSISDRQVPSIEQRTLAHFIAEGHFERHLAKMRRLYASRRTAALDALAHHLPGRHACDRSETAAGLHLLVSLTTSLPEPALLSRLHAAGIQIDGGSPCYLTPPNQPCVMLGYASQAEPAIAAGIAHMAEMLRESEGRREAHVR